jgi:hypothetical protein
MMKTTNRLHRAHISTYPRTRRGPEPRNLQFQRDLLPDPWTYFTGQGLKIKGGGEWKTALCPFHADTTPSLRLRIDSGGFRCMVCGAHGGDVLAFHMQRYNLPFIKAARELGALFQ